MSEVQLGKTTGSLVNALYALESVKVPNIGDGATILSWTDRHPATVIDIEEKGKYVYVTTQEDRARRVDNNGFSENQKYLYLPNPKPPENPPDPSTGGPTRRVLLRRKGSALHPEAQRAPRC